MSVAAKMKKPANPLPKKGKTSPGVSKPDTKPRLLATMPKPPQLVSSLLASNAPKLPARLQTTIDKQEITDLIADFCRGLDRMDETILRSVCHMDATLDLGPGVFQGGINDYIVWILGVLSQVRLSHHLVGSTRIEIEGDTAAAETYVQTYYRLDKPTGREDLFIGGRFLDRLERRPTGSSGVWKIVHRKHVLDWTRTEAVSEVFYHQNPDALWSNRTKKDLSHAMSLHGGQKPSVAVGRHFDPRSIKL